MPSALSTIVGFNLLFNTSYTIKSNIIPDYTNDEDILYRNGAFQLKRIKTP